MKSCLIKQTVLKAVGKVVELEVNKMSSNWHGACIGLLHQPKRPQKM